MAIFTLDNLKTHVVEVGSLSSSYGHIADYVAHNLRDVSLMSATDLADASQVSQSTVSRFCMDLGFQGGFGQFVRTIQDLVREEWQAPDRARHLRRITASQDEPLVAEETANLAQLPEIVSSQATKHLVQFVMASPRLVLAGTRTSATLIPYAAYFLSKIRDGVEVATPETSLWTSLASHPQQNVAILAFVFPRYPAVLVDWMRDVRRCATPIAAITDRPQSPAIGLTQPTVVIPVARASLFDSYAAMMVFINYLIKEAAATVPNIESRLAALEHYEALHRVYGS